MLYCLKRINDPCHEHVGNNFPPVPVEYTYNFLSIQKQLQDIFRQTEEAISASEINEQTATAIREQAESIHKELSSYRKQVIDAIQKSTVNIESATIFLNIIQESQQILSCLRHILRSVQKFTEPTN